MRFQKYMFLLIFTLFQLHSFSQLSFNNQASYYSTTPGYSTICIAVADMNADGLDDIVRINHNVLEIIYQRLDGSSYVYKRISSIPSYIYSILAANFDDDKELEILIGAAAGVFYLQIDPTYSIQQIQTGYLPQTMSALDFNNDRKLDIFICNDIGQNVCLINDGNNTFHEENDRFEIKVIDAESNRGNYGSVFSDIDNDGDQDLYITKCNPIAPAGHPSRINILYLNDGSGHFTIADDNWGINADDQSWAADFGDYDLDGDMDLIVVNHDVANIIYRNDGDHFTDMSTIIPLGTTKTALEVKWADLNGDGRLDIIISGEEHAIYLNEGNEKFTRQANPFGLYNMLSFGLSDFNRDGKIDIYASYGTSIYEPSTVPDRIFINNTKTHNQFYGLRVLDSLHQNAIGARVVLYVDTIAFISDIRAGESYGITCSNLLTFSIPSGQAIDSIMIQWPSGKRYTISHDHFPESKFLTPGYFMTYAEDFCQSPALLFGIVDDKLHFCDGDSAIAYLDGDGRYQFTSDTEFVDFRKSIFDDTFLGGYAYHNDCRTFSPLYHFEKNPEQSAILVLDKEPNYCAGEKIKVSTDPAFPVLNWQNNSQDSILIVSQNATVFARLQGLCNEIYTDTFQLNFVETSAPIAFSDTVKKDSTAILIAVGDSIWWYESLTNGVPFYMGDSLIISPVLKSDTFYIRNVLETGIRNIITGFSADSSKLAYGSSSFNGGLEFNALQDIIIDSVTVITDIEGLRLIQLKDKDDFVIASKSVLVPVGKNKIELNFEVPAGLGYLLTTDPNTNLQNLGFESPKFTRERSLADFPYTVPKLLEITQSNLGTDYYYYFYDWHISTKSKLCISDPVSISVIVSETGSVSQHINKKFLCNMQNGELSFSAPFTGSAILKLFDVNGKEIFGTTQFIESDARISHKVQLIPGIYFITLQFKDRLFHAKLRMD